MYAVIDIETTGGSPVHEKITEIAIYLYDGNKVTGEFSTLVNPEKNIPYHITALTGISNEMVADAPKFFEIARQIVKLTENCIFVAHNVSFDYGFIHTEFGRLGYNYKRDKLCTVKLSRKLVPGKRSYSLGNICTDLGISIEGRHRAAGDALATVKLLDLLLHLNEDNAAVINEVAGLSARNLHHSFRMEVLKTLPEEPGVYYFLDENQQIIYVGKSRNLSQRVFSHFSGHTTKSALRLRENIASLDFVQTGSELIALLLESEEIKKHKPRFNRAQKRALSNFGIFSFQSPDGYHCLTIGNTTVTSDTPHCTFNSKKDAQGFMESLVDKYNLCQKLCGLYPSTGACFHFDIRQCRGACVGLESQDLYNMRVEQALHMTGFREQNFLIIDRGRHEEERCVVKVERGQYVGFGYIDQAEAHGLDSLHECIRRFADNHDVQQIIGSYLRNHRVEKIIPF
jgi:DNA polymerase III subunit epsilon